MHTSNSNQVMTAYGPRIDNSNKKPAPQGNHTSIDYAKIISEAKEKISLLENGYKQKHPLESNDDLHDNPCHVVYKLCKFNTSRI